MELVIRSLTPDDLAPIYPWLEGNPLFSQYGMKREKLQPLLSRAALDSESALVGAFDSVRGKLRGFAWFMKKGAFGRSGYLRLIAVDPTAKGGGVGRALMDDLESKFLAPNGIFLLATHSNSDAHHFYSRLGYRKVGEIPNYVVQGLDEVIFHKPPSR